MKHALCLFIAALGAAMVLAGFAVLTWVTLGLSTLGLATILAIWCAALAVVAGCGIAAIALEHCNVL